MSRPSGVRSVAVTVAAVLSVYEICVESPAAGGVAVADLIVNGTGAAPIVPVAARTKSPALIDHVYTPTAAVVASHVQSTASPVPFPVATAAPVGSVTVTTQGSGWDRRAWNLTSPPSWPCTEGA